MKHEDWTVRTIPRIHPTRDEEIVSELRKVARFLNRVLDKELERGGWAVTDLSIEISHQKGAVLDAIDLIEELAGQQSAES